MRLQKEAYKLTKGKIPRRNTLPPPKDVCVVAKLVDGHAGVDRVVFQGRGG